MPRGLSCCWDSVTMAILLSAQRFQFVDPGKSAVNENDGDIVVVPNFDGLRIKSVTHRISKAAFGRTEQDVDATAVAQPARAPFAEDLIGIFDAVIVFDAEFVFFSAGIGVAHFPEFLDELCALLGRGFHEALFFFLADDVANLGEELLVLGRQASHGLAVYRTGGQFQQKEHEQAAQGEGSPSRNAGPGALAGDVFSCFMFLSIFI